MFSDYSCIIFLFSRTLKILRLAMDFPSLKQGSAEIPPPPEDYRYR